MTGKTDNKQPVAKIANTNIEINRNLQHTDGVLISLWIVRTHTSDAKKYDTKCHRQCRTNG